MVKSGYQLQLSERTEEQMSKKGNALKESMALKEGKKGAKKK